MIIRNKIDFGYLATSKIVESSTKLHYFIKFTYLRVLALTKRPKDVNAKIRSQKPVNAKVREH